MKNNVHGIEHEGQVPAHSGGTEDTALLAEVAQGSEDALVALYRRYVKLVFSLSSHILRDSIVAEEVTQDVFIKLWRHPRAWDSHQGRFPSWLLTVARHTAIDRLRQEHRQPRLVFVSGVEDCPVAPQESIVPGDSDQALHLALEELPVVQREVIELAYFGGMTQQGMADFLHLPLGTVKTRIRLGMQKMQKMQTMWQLSAEIVHDRSTPGKTR